LARWADRAIREAMLKAVPEPPVPRSASRFLAASVGPAGMALATLLAGCERQTQAAAPVMPPVQVETVTPAAAANGALRYSATIQPIVQVNVAFKVGGYVARLAEVPGVARARRPLQ
jgi:hypothetical protein